MSLLTTTSSWKDICEQYTKNVGNRQQVMSELIINLEPYMLEKYSQYGDSHEYECIKNVLKDRKNCTEDIKEIVCNFITYCVGDTFKNITDNNKLLIQIKKKWRLYVDCSHRNELFKHIDTIIETKRNNIVAQNDIIELEKSKEQLKDELYVSKKEIAVLKIENENFRQKNNKLRTEIDECNTTSIENSHLTQNIKHLNKQLEDMKNTNKALMNILSNLTQHNPYTQNGVNENGV